MKTDMTLFVAVLAIGVTTQTASAGPMAKKLRECADLLTRLSERYELEENEMETTTMAATENKMQPYNTAFFGLYQLMFRQYRERHGMEETLRFMSEDIFPNALGPAYDQMGFQRGNVQDFARVIRERDNAVGIRVELPVVKENRIVYRFLTDPFPNLKGLVDPHDLDATYLRFKVRYLLGENWTYTTTQHIWEGAPYSEHIITRVQE